MHCMERCLNCPFIFLKGNCKEAGSPTDQRCTREPGPVLLIQSSSKYTHRNRQKQPCAAEEMYIFKNDYVEGWAKKTLQFSRFFINIFKHNVLLSKQHAITWSWLSSITKWLVKTDLLWSNALSLFLPPAHSNLAEQLLNGWPLTLLTVQWHRQMTFVSYRGMMRIGGRKKSKSCLREKKKWWKV